jgi:hypothetical protein
VIRPVLLKNIGRKEAGCSRVAFQELPEKDLEYSGKRNGVQLMRTLIRSIQSLLLIARYA